MKWYAAFLLFPLGAFLSASKGEQEPPSAFAKPSICSILETIKGGDQIPVVVSGIYAVGQEMQILYDPSQLKCKVDVQPSTWVEFSPTVADVTQLDYLLEHDRRAYVTLKGTFFGPNRLGPDDRALNWMIAYAQRTRGGRYGHMGAFRTKFVVDAVIEAMPVPASVSWNAIWRPNSAAESVEIESAEMPRYPTLAYRAGISGEVEIEVKVSSGKVMETKVKSGDRMLAPEAERNIRTWKFNSGVTSTFTSKFVYLLEKGPRRPDRNPKIELEYPFLVKITAPYFGW